MNVKDITKEQFIKVCESSQSMAQAASTLGLHFNTFKTHAIKHGCYKTNQPGKGLKKNIGNKVEFKDIKTRSGIRRRIIEENLIPYKCNECGISEWNGKKLSLHLDHVNGSGWDHDLNNLRFLCPNCHSQTSTYTGKNK
jgi:predicted RNA-binding Zn-ribbon protein involved in translation (DUF1610 family)